MSILVAGSSGFVGRYVVRALRASGTFVVGADLNPLVGDICPDNFHSIDLTDHNKCQELIREYAIQDIYCLAADTGGLAYQRSHGAGVAARNLAIVSSLLEASRDRGVKRFLFSSSVWASACENLLNTGSGTPIPLSAQEYSLSKLLSEKVCKSAGESLGIEVRIGRIHNVFGPHAPYFGGREGIVAAFCRDVARAPSNSKIVLNAHPNDRRSYLHVEDCAEGFLRLMKSSTRESIELGSPESLSLKQLGDLVIAVSGKKLELQFMPQPGSSGISRECDCTQMKGALNWAPGRPLAESIAETYRWILRECEDSIS